MVSALPPVGSCSKGGRWWRIGFAAGIAIHLFRLCDGGGIDRDRVPSRYALRGVLGITSNQRLHLHRDLLVGGAPFEPLNKPSTRPLPGIRNQEHFEGGGIYPS